MQGPADRADQGNKGRIQEIALSGHTAMTRDERRQVLKIVEAHERTIGISEACARTTRDLAAEVRRGGVPSREDLQRTIDEAERILDELAAVRIEVERL